MMLQFSQKRFVAWGRGWICCFLKKVYLQWKYLNSFLMFFIYNGSFFFFELKKVWYDMIKLEYNNIAVYVSLKNTAKTQIWHRNAPHLYFMLEKHSVARNKMCGKLTKTIVFLRKNLDYSIFGTNFFRQYIKGTAIHLRILCTYLSGWWIIDENIPLCIHP